MWPTLDGVRVLKGDEATLVRDALDVMVDQLTAELRDDAEQHLYGIDWFDQWDCEQRIWLLEQIAIGLLTPESPPPPAAIWEATIDTLLVQVIELISDEIDRGLPIDNEHSWRRRVIDAFECQQGKAAIVDGDETELRQWRSVVTRIANAILGVTCYQQAESFRDGDSEQTCRFLMEKGMPPDFLQRIPPLQTAEQTERSLQRILAVV